MLRAAIRNKLTIAAAASLSIVIIIGILTFQKITIYKLPEITLSANNATAQAAVCGYNWNFGFSRVVTKGISPYAKEYTAENILTLAPGTEIIISSGKTVNEKKNAFTLLSMDYSPSNQEEAGRAIDSLNVQGNTLRFNVPWESGNYIYTMQLQFKHGEVSYCFKIIVADDNSSTLETMKGLELYVWKNKELTGNTDTYFTLLPGTNRIKTKSEIYDQSTAVKSIEAVNDLLSKYRKATYLAVFQMHTKDFTKAEIAAITDKLKLPAANHTISAGLWPGDEDTAANGYFQLTQSNHIYTFAFNGQEFKPSDDFIYMDNSIKGLDEATYFQVNELYYYAKDYSGLADEKLQKLLDYNKTISVEGKDYINLIDLQSLGIYTTIGWTLSSHTPVYFSTKPIETITAD